MSDIFKTLGDAINPNQDKKPLIGGVERPFKQQPIGKKDMFNKEIVEGHIVAVRYVWNSYAAPIFFYGYGFALLVTTSPKGHPISDTATYQIIGHWDKEHADYNQEVKDWILNKCEGNCPVEINVYDTSKQD